MSYPKALQAYLSGAPRFDWGGEALEIESRKPLAMLCYLCLRGGEIEREQLAELLWGQGRLLNVRQALYQLRQLPGADDWLRVGELVSVVGDSDVGRFERAVEAEEYGAALSEWEPPLLGELAIAKAPAFREWLELERSRLDGLYLRCLEERAAELEREGEFAAALDLTIRFIERDPLRESAYRGAMRLSYLLGDRDGALDHYRRCLRAMREELDSEPLPTTVALAETITRGGELTVAVAPGHLQQGLLRLLRTIVVGRGRLGTGVLARALELDEFEVAESLVELERRRLVGSGGEVSPTIVRETLATVPEQVRRLIHGRIAAALEAGNTVGLEDVIGEHWLGAHSPEAAAPWLLRALRRAQGEHDDQKALLLGFRTLWSGETGQRLEAVLLLEGQADRAGDGELQDALLELGKELAWELQGDRELALLDLRRARRLLALGEADEALALAEEALGIARRLEDPGLLAQAVSVVGVTHYQRGALSDAKSYFEENSRSPLKHERYRALNNLGAVSGLTGDLPGSYRYLEQALTLAREMNNVEDVGACLNNLAATAERMAQYGRAAARLREGRDLSRRTGHARIATQALLNMSHVHCRRGALGPAWNTGQEALAEAEELDDSRLRGLALEQLGQVARAAGDPQASSEQLVQAARIFEGVGDERKQESVRCNLAMTALLNGDEDEVAVARQLERLDEQGTSEFTRWFWAELCLLANDPARIREWSCRVGAGPENPHVALLSDLVGLRSELLELPGDAAAPDGLEARLEDLEVLEGPLGYLMLARCTAGAAASEYLATARRLFESQGEGLPRALRESLRTQCESWLQPVPF